MKKMLSLGIAAGMLVAASTAFAFPTIQGWTGGFNVPTAATQMGWTVAVDRAEGENARIPNIRVLGQVIPNLEVGAGIESTNRISNLAANATFWNVNAKYALPIELAGAKLAVGATYGQGSDDVDLKNWHGYLSGTIPVMGADATLALVYQDVSGSLVGLAIPDQKRLSPQIGIEKKAENGSAIGAEYVFNNSIVDQPISMLRMANVTKAADSYGTIYARLMLNDALQARVALTDINEPNIGTTFVAGLAYSFGGGK